MQAMHISKKQHKNLGVKLIKLLERGYINLKYLNQTHYYIFGFEGLLILEQFSFLLRIPTLCLS
ncbi:hypothetical protein ACE6H2_009585 [Prunus campanulata]